MGSPRGPDSGRPGLLSSKPGGHSPRSRCLHHHPQTGIEEGRGQPGAQETTLGWILSGQVGSAEPPARALTLQCKKDDDLTCLVKNFWQQEKLPAGPAPLTPAEQECEDLYRTTHSRQADGRYVVRLPVVASLPDFATTKRAALRCLVGIEGRFARDNRLHRLYVDFLREYEALNHMTRADTAKGKRVSYLPHHGVLREASSTTKLRVVFNGSTTTISDDSLNRSLLVRQDLLPPLAELLL
ncbi:uncharacterized protein LOC114940772 [Nylanderia fulva]|uniref:uncharacterized protein LOC114940772 n=1 Tax=Nylanderia fulva TaxID=613905 RepID=UPI0010FAFE47|nr:uncharacterized protein LOC114940772 [Nylanderia fulva]